MIAKHVGEASILNEMAEHAISEAYVQILQEEKIEAIGRPHISITKLAAGNPLEFVIETDVLPEVQVGDYKKIAKKAYKNEKKEEVSDDELAKALQHLRRIRTHNTQMAELPDGAEPIKITDIKDEDLMELDDEFVQTLGKFENVEDFTTKLRQNLQDEKDQKATDKIQIEIIEGIIADSKFEVPSVLTDFEVDKLYNQMEYDISMNGMKMEDYLKQIKKTAEELRTEWRPEAEKRAKMQLIFNKIAADEKIEPSKEEIEAEMSQLKERYGDMKDFNEDRARGYVLQVLLNQKVVQHIEAAGK